MNKKIHVFLFTLKTVYFSPVNNPIFYCMLIVSGIMLFSGDLKKHETVLFLLLAAISHRLMPAIQLTSLSSHKNRTGIFSLNINMLPVKKNVFFVSLLLSAAFYISILLSIGYYAGTASECPPVVESLCPPHTVKAFSLSGEPNIYVEGISSYGNMFTIPLSSSLLFKYLASDVIFSKEIVTEEFIRKHCPGKEISPENLFTGNFKKISSIYFSSFLENVRYSNYISLLFVIIFSFVFFLYDGMCIFMGSMKSNGKKIIFRVIDIFMYTIYAALCTTLILDTILPESIIAQASSNVNVNKLFGPVLIFGAAGCGCRLLSFLSAEKDGKYK